MGALPPPRYGEATVADLSRALLGALEVPDATDDVGLPPVRAYVLLVVDGLGWRQLHEHADDAPYLAARATRQLDAAHPSTTATNLGSLGTATPPGEHGLVGYTVGLPDDDRPFNLLTWALGPHLQGESQLDRVIPELYQPVPTIWQRAHDAGIAVTTVVRPEFVGTGLTRAVLRGGRMMTASDLATAWDLAVTESRRDGRSLAYVHHGDLDTVGHTDGPGSPSWRAELRRIDTTLAALAARLPPDVAVLVTADHGMLHIPPTSLIDVTDEPRLLNGIRLVAGEARARQLHCRPDRAQEVADRWTDRLGDRFRVLLRDDAIAAGWFGPVVTDTVRERIGDVLVWAMTPDGAIVNGALDPGRGRMLGMHGSVTRAEVEVPLIVLQAV
jgi:hypothetical protein